MFEYDKNPYKEASRMLDQPKRKELNTQALYRYRLEVN